MLAGFGVSLDEVLESEADAGLGNGGLGRLAACFLESMATLGMPGFGYGIDYEYGLFKQEIFNGFQREKPDRWKANGTPFQIEHPEEAVNIPMYGTVDGPREVDAQPASRAWTEPQDRGRHSDRHADRWLSRADGELAAPVHGARLGRLRHRDLQPRRLHSRRRAEDRQSENISRVLYPSDSVMSGKELRLVQEYFLVACAMGDIMRALPPAAQAISSCCPRRSPSR